MVPETGRVHRAALCLTTPSLWPTHGCLSPHPLPTGPIIVILSVERGHPAPTKDPLCVLYLLSFFSSPPYLLTTTQRSFPLPSAWENTPHPSSSSSAPPCSHLSWRPGWRFSTSPGNSTVTTGPVWTEPCGSRRSAWGQEEGRCTDHLRQTALNSFTLGIPWKALSLWDFERQAVQDEKKIRLCMAFLHRSALMS